MTVLRNWKRFIAGLVVALRVILSYRIARTLWFFLSPEERSSRMGMLHRRNAGLIRVKAIEMKGVMIKVGQFLSSRIDFLPDEYIQELSQLQDSVPPHDYGEIREALVNALPSPPEDVFAEFSHTPIAAASLGQVHKAALGDGKQVAVKIQYPDIHAIIETDIAMFKILVWLFRGRYGRINLALLHEEFSRIVRAELDYVQEAKNAERFRKNFEGDDRVVIPAVIWEYSGKTVLTLEYVSGIKITECDTVQDSGIDCRETVNLLSETYSRMIFLHGFFHGDPHPGNVFVQEGPRLVFVDFGMVQVIPGRIKRDLRRFADAIVESDARAIVDSLESMGFIVEGADFGELTEVAQSLVDKYRTIAPTELKSLTVDDISDEIDRLFRIVHYIQIPNNFILLGRTIGMLNGVAFRLNPDVNIIEIGKPFIKEFLRGTRREQQEQLIRDVRRRIADLWELPLEMKEFLSKANRGDVSVRISRADLAHISAQSRTMTSVMLLVVLSVTSAASSLFFMIIGSEGTALLAAGAAVLLGVISVVRLFRG